MNNSKNIVNELKDIGIDIPNGLKSPMDCPLDFFTNFSESVLDLIKEEDFLATMPKKMPFALPKDYFQDFENELKTKIEIEKKEIKPLRLTHTKTQVFSIAASIILFLGLGFMFLKPTKTINIEQQLTTISINEINAYIMQHQVEFATDIVTESIDETNVDVNKLENEIIESQINDLTKEDLKNYL